MGSPLLSSFHSREHCLSRVPVCYEVRSYGSKRVEILCPLAKVVVLMSHDFTRFDIFQA